MVSLRQMLVAALKEVQMIINDDQGYIKFLIFSWKRDVLYTSLHIKPELSKLDQSLS